MRWHEAPAKNRILLATLPHFPAPLCNPALLGLRGVPFADHKREQGGAATMSAAVYYVIREEAAVQVGQRALFIQCLSVVKGLFRREVEKPVGLPL